MVSGIKPLLQSLALNQKFLSVRHWGKKREREREKKPAPLWIQRVLELELWTEHNLSNIASLEQSLYCCTSTFGELNCRKLGAVNTEPSVSCIPSWVMSEWVIFGVSNFYLIFHNFSKPQSLYTSPKLSKGKRKISKPIPLVQEKMS